MIDMMSCKRQRIFQNSGNYQTNTKGSLQNELEKQQLTVVDTKGNDLGKMKAAAGRRGEFRADQNWKSAFVLVSRREA